MDAESLKPLTFEPIGVFKTSQKRPVQAARQAVTAAGAEGYIQLKGRKNFQQALELLDTFSHIWLVYAFHKNSAWKPKVQAPRRRGTKVGVFATRSPYRPNSVGISAVRLLRIEGLKIYIQGHDLLDGTPILDLKPYLRYADAIADANEGWTASLEAERFQISLSSQAEETLQTSASTCPELRQVIENQLTFDPLNSQKKRSRKLSENSWIFSYQKWRAQFSCSDRKIRIEKIWQDT